MQKILGHIRKACTEFEMIQDGDTVAVGLSGGKDSILLMTALKAYSRFSPQSFTVKAITIDMRYDGNDTDFSALTAYCESIGVEHIIERTDIGQIVFDVRKEPNPCSLCANMRRGALMNAAEKAGCSKVALGHHFDDVVETFILNLFREGRIGCFSPVTGYPDKNCAVIRPLVLAEESEIAACCRRNNFPVTKSQCPADKKTSREEVKQWLKEREKTDRGFRQRLFTALRKNGTDGWNYR